MKKKKGAGVNIGTVLFGAIALYMLISVIMYLTSDHISSYLVTPGTLSSNERYTALAIRDETLVTAKAGGFVTYYVEDGGKTSQGSVVCSVGSDASAGTTAADIDLSRVREQASAFSNEYSPDKYSSVYDFRYMLRNGAAGTADKKRTGGTASRAPIDGVVCYTSDGMEDLTIASVTKESFHPENYNNKQLRTGGTVDAGMAMYRVVSNDTWDLLLELTERQYAVLSGRKYVKLRFEKDGMTEKGDLKLFERDGSYYADVTLYGGMVRYRNERFINVELITTNLAGLKVPLSAIVTKEFYIIPKDFYMAPTTNTDAGFMTIRDPGNEKKTTTGMVDCDLYAKLETDAGETVYYVDKADFHKGDIILKENSNETFTIGETGTLEGVYATNKGYAQFRRAIIIDQNDEYCIVEEGVDYGVSQYDYIVRDSSMVDESQILH